MIIYGSMLCKDCVECREALDKASVKYEFRDFALELKNLKEFLQIRDHNSMFEPIKEAGGIGIPCIVLENGEITLDWEEFI